MHVLIITDLEGVSCVDDYAMMPYDSVGYKNACEYLMADLNATIDGAFLGGATKVTVVDGHGGGQNFKLELLDKRATYIPIREFIDNSPEGYGYDALMCVGAHAMAGTEKAFLDHTQSSTEWFEYCINGTPCGEMAQEAYFLGAFGAPFVMMSGDKAACEEAKALVPNIATACVKTALRRNKAECLPLEEALELIRTAAKDGVQRVKDIKPCILDLPCELKITYTRNDHCDYYAQKGIKRDGRTLTGTLKKITKYSDFTDFKGE